MSKGTLMAIFAHPDDEAFGTGGSLSKYAAEGYDVYLVTATRGEAGQVAESSQTTLSNLPFVREQELRCACETYGIHPPRFLEYVDGQLPMVHQGQAVGKIVRLLRELRPQVVITFGPDGIYGHYDHIAVHRWASIAVKLAAEPDCFPEQLASTCRPHQVDKLYYRVLPEDQVAAMTEGDEPASVEMDGVPFFFSGHPQEEITTLIDVSDYLEQKEKGIRCHATQVGPQERDEGILSEEFIDQWMRYEAFVLAHSTVGQPEEPETDLFAGINE